MEAEAKQIPVTILTGFLGAGKTTLLNHILQSPDHGMRFAIIENEFGEVGVDDKVLKEEIKDELVEVLNGCVCCTVRGDLVKALKRLEERISSFDAVIIETTGLADPAPVAQTFFVDKDVSRSYRLDGIITVVDAKHILPRLQEEKPEGVENESVEQVAFADRILLNKCDLVSAEALQAVEKAIKDINAQVEIIQTKHSKVEPSKLLNIGAFDIDKVVAMDPEFLNTDGEHEHDTSVSSVSVRFAGELNFVKLKKWIRKIMKEHGVDLFRYKGVLAVVGTQMKYVFQGVHMIFSGGLEAKCRWKLDEERECRFVFIGRNLDKKTLQDGILACKVEPLRFEEGTSVEVYIGWKEWFSGTIIQTWDEGYPYLVEPDMPEDEDACPAWVWVPEDTDNFIRRPASNGAYVVSK